jgi:hypothetical protein
MELQFNNAAEKRVVEEISQLLISKDYVKSNPKKRSRSNTIKYDLSEKTKNKILPHYNSEIRKEILKDISIDELHNSNETLNHEVSNLVKEVTEFKHVDLYASEWHTFTALSEYYKKEAPNKLIVVLGEQEFPVSPNYLYIQQLCDFNELLKTPQRIAAILLDPFFFIQRSANYYGRINTLRKQCSGSGIDFILDERKTAARIHLKGINFVFQFKADAILFGANFTNGIPLGAIASSRSISGDSALPRAYAPSSLALMACKKITEKFIALGNVYHTQQNIKANRFTEKVNHYFPKKKQKATLHNFGTILWLSDTARLSLPGRLRAQGIFSPNTSIMYLPSSLDAKEFTDLAHRISLAIKKPSRKKSGRFTNKTTT